ncbi:hypothetical protein GS885_27740 [Rhodococcus hoagii]|nr:hypothetical protein [Prescottella equi]
MRERDLSQQRSFWLSQFEKEAPVLDLPYDYPRLKQQSFKVEQCQCTCLMKLRKRFISLRKQQVVQIT